MNCVCIIKCIYVIYVTFNYLINLYRDLMRLNSYNTTNNFQRELKRLKTDNQIIDNEKMPRDTIVLYLHLGLHACMCKAIKRRVSRITYFLQIFTTKCTFRHRIQRLQTF